MRSVIRSARVWIVNGTSPPLLRTSLANSCTQSTRKPKMSSANQTWSGRKARCKYVISAATAAGLRCRYWLPQIGLAHHVQRNGQPRDAAMLRLKNPCASCHTAR